MLVELETRATPAYFRWNPPGDNYNWHVADNWDEANGPGFVDNQTGRHPGADDKVEFSSVPLVAGESGPGVRSAPICIVSVTTTVNYLLLKPDFTATVFLDQPLAVDSLTDRGFMDMAGSAGTIAGGFGGGHGQLDIGSLIKGKGTTLFWEQGQFRNVTVTVEQGSDLNIASSPAGRVMTSTIFHINGKLYWLGGDVTVAGAGTSTVVINPTGRFDIISSGKWGSGANYRTQSLFQKNAGRSVSGWHASPTRVT